MFKCGTGLMLALGLRHFSDDLDFTAGEQVAVEPGEGSRTVKVTERRTKKDFAVFVKEVLKWYAKAAELCVVPDNLNIHFPGLFKDVT